MSSGIDADGIVAAAVILPVVAAFGAGWIAWQSGKLLVEANKAIDRQIAEKKLQLEEEASHRKMTAIAAHSQLVEMCFQILSNLNVTGKSGQIFGLAEIEQIKNELESICNENLPDDVAQIESITSLGYLKIDRYVRQQQQLASMVMQNSLYQGSSVADLMDDLRVVIGAMEVHELKGSNVIAANPDILERIKLNKEFASVTAEIMRALETVELLSKKYGLNSSASVWFHSCFNGIDVQIETMCSPTISNGELKKGICRLRDSIERYNMLSDSIADELNRMNTLYKVYVDAAKALGETVLSIKEFKNSSEIEKKLLLLKQRAEKAQKCAEIYKKLGPSAYLCFAWDQELKAMGYEVYSREKLNAVSGSKPAHASVDDHKLPFYEWSNEDLTQLYSIGSDCSLQIIVHDDGTVSMQTIADAVNDDVIHRQRRHCAQLASLHKRLRENWFVLYDFEETKSPNDVTTQVQWRVSNKNAWRTQNDAFVTGQRTKEKRKEKGNGKEQHT